MKHTSKINPGNVKNLLVLLLISVAGKEGLSQLSYNKNFVAVAQMKVPGVYSVQQANNLPSVQRKITVEYLDGLGRSEQKVDVSATATGFDMIMPMKYDNLGRTPKQYLPYTVSTTTGGSGSFRTTWEADQLSFYQNNNPTTLPNDLPDSYPFSITEFEPSPLNRPNKAFAPGSAWAGTQGTGNEVAVKTEYKVYNSVADLVKTWEYNNTTATAIPVISTAYTYQTGDLMKSISINEHGNKVEEYTDKAGKTILKKVQLSNTPGMGEPHAGWLCTYYIYNNLNQLCYVLQPKAVEWLRNNNWVLTQSIIDELCFWYEYDNQGRLIAKHVPGAKPVYMVYDKRDRLVFTQDANMRNQQKWIITLYDPLNRVIGTAFWNSATTRAVLQAQVDADNAPEQELQTLLGDSFALNYKPTFVLISALDLLTLSFYDKYPQDALSGNPLGFDANYSLPYSPMTITSNGEYAEDVTVNGLNIIGQITVTKVKVLDPNAGTPQYLGTSTWYDKNYRVLQTVKQNIQQNGKDITTTQYSFTGKVLGTWQAHSPHAVTVITKNELDIDGRVTAVYKGINSSSATKLVSAQEYDWLGRLRTKTTGGNTIAENKEDYTYNIRGWVRGVNLNYLNGQILPTNQRNFGYELAYNSLSAGIAGTNTSLANPQLNGNIGAMIWASAGKAGRDAQGIWQPSPSGILRKYDYLYDNTNRLKKADFQENKNGWFNLEKDFSVSGNDNGAIGYDENGNILSMNHKGVDGTSIELIDILTYSYHNNGNSNRLKAVDDASINNRYYSSLGDFIEGPGGKGIPGIGHSSEDYTYDDNGNMLNDLNKPIYNYYTGGNGIEYNHLNLPAVVHTTSNYGDALGPKGNIKYIYDALGNKLKKIVTDELASPSPLITTTTYCGSFTYTNTDLTQIAYEEGRIRWALQPGGGREYKYDWMIKDHLGNIRMVLTEEPNPSTQRQYLATFEDEATQTVTKEQIAMEKELFGEDVLQPVRSKLPEELKDKNPGNRKAALLRPGTLRVPYKIVKAAPGDKFSISVEYYYRQRGNKKEGKSVREDILKNILNQIIKPGSNTPGANAHGATNAARTNMGAGVINGPAMRSYAQNPPSEGREASRPRAYLNYLFLDTALQPIKGGALQVGNADEDWQTLAETELETKQRGYFLTYISNDETPTADLNDGAVYFDNLRLITNEGPIMEENHYYPFGLIMDAISSTGTGKLENKYKYNGKEEQRQEFSDGSGLEWLDYGARMYDAQTGRWMAVDPLSDQMSRHSPYNYAYDNPIKFIDPDGKEIRLGFQDQASQDAYLSMVQKSLGSNYKVSIVPITGDGIYTHRVVVTHIASRYEGPTTESERAFLSDYISAIDSKDIVRQEIVMNDAGTNVGSWVTGRVDMADLPEFDKAGKWGASSSGVLIHETSEQLSKAQKGLLPGDIGSVVYAPSGMPNYVDFKDSHWNAAIPSENRVNGNTRGFDMDDEHFLEKNGTITIQSITQTASGGISVSKTNIDFKAIMSRIMLGL